MKYFTLTVASLLLVGACGGQALSTNDSDAGPITDAGLTSDAAPSDETCPTPPPSINSPNYKITFHLTNVTTIDRWLGSELSSCSPFPIAGTYKKDVDGLPGYNAVCPGPQDAGILPPGSGTMIRLAAGASVDIVWTAVETVEYRDCGQCFDKGIVHFENGAQLPLTPGTYKLTFPITGSIPSNCKQVGDTLNCGYAGDISKACTFDDSTTITFTATGSNSTGAVEVH